MAPLFSVIIPCFNLGKYLPECILSVQKQEYKNFELIIVDDGSTDVSTINYLKSLEQENMQIHFQKNMGVSAARNYGASFSKGDYLLFLDADDKIAPDYFRLAFEYLQKGNDPEYIYCDLLEFEGGDAYRSVGDLTLKAVLLHAVTHVSGIIKRSLWERSGGFDTDFVNGWEDWDFLIRITASGIRCYKIPGAMLLYRIRTGSRDRQANEKHNRELEQKIFLKNIHSYLSIYNEPLTVLRAYEQQKDAMDDLRLHIKNIYSTHSYKLGSILLRPLKYLSARLKKQ